MPKPYSLDLRQKIVNAYDRGDISQRGLAKQFGVNGLITNDKFCFVREVHLQLSRSRVPLNRRI